MRREGSPFTGVGAVFAKEFADHLTSVRMRVLELLVVLVSVGLVAALVVTLRRMGDLGEDRFLFLYLFSLAREQLWPLYIMLGLLLPVFAIGLGFDAVNSEFNRRTMSRVLAQPVYRDAVLLGKFFAGLATLTVCLLVIWLLIVGGGLLILGVPPSSEEVARSLAFMFASLAFGAVWLALALLFSVVFRSGATSVLCALGIWLFFWLAWPTLAQLVAEQLVPVSQEIFSSQQSMIDFARERADIQQLLTRLSPATLYTEAAIGLLHPSTRTLENSTQLLEQVMPAMRRGVVQGAPLRLEQSLLLVWPQIVALISGTILLFAIAYVSFQRQEVRA
jgi:ABC-2 type transport system permease protein